MRRVNSGTKKRRISSCLASAATARSLVVPKSYAAGLKMYCPGGALFQTGRLKSPAHSYEQQPCQPDASAVTSAAGMSSVAGNGKPGVAAPRPQQVQGIGICRAFWRARTSALTPNADVKINERVSLRPIWVGLAWLKSRRLRSPAARSGVASCPRSGPPGAPRPSLQSWVWWLAALQIGSDEAPNRHVITSKHFLPHMALHFSPLDTPLRDLEIWHASTGEYSFAISHESRNGPSHESRNGPRLRDKPGFIASWRSRYNNKPAITVQGSPFATFVQAEEACERKLVQLTSYAE
jgi:hypothetical protein